eukprot:scaffold1093_cov359-Prasinococcus_capsulatus_cf.AAC.11
MDADLRVWGPVLDGDLAHNLSHHGACNAPRELLVVVGRAHPGAAAATPALAPPPAPSALAARALGAEGDHPASRGAAMVARAARRLASRDPSKARPLPHAAQLG